MISANSRYVNQTVDVVTDARGTHQAISEVDPISGVINFTYYQVAEYDTPDKLAYETLGDGRLWWMIANANPEILDWTSLKVGTIIRIPSA